MFLQVEWFQDAALPEGAAQPVLVLDMAGGAPVLDIYAGQGGRATLTLDGGLALEDGFIAADPGFDLLQAAGHSYALRTDLIERLAAEPSGPSGAGNGVYSGDSGFFGDFLQLIRMPDSGGDIWIAALPGQAGFYQLTRAADGRFSVAQHYTDTTADYAADVAALAYVTLNGTHYLYVAGRGEDGVSAYRVTSEGPPDPVDHLGVAEGVGLSRPDVLTPVMLDGQGFLLVGAAGSSSLTVFALASDGTMTLTDHRIDDLAMRFDGITALASVVSDGRAYVVAGGRDDGLSLFELLPDGRLVHLQSLADPLGGLQNVQTLEIAAIGGKLHIFATAEGAGGITHAVADPGPAGTVITGGATAETLTGGDRNDLLSGGAGDDSLQGGAGDDTLLDGHGADRLRGGEGADLFVLSADGARDEILDFDPAADRIDFSAYDGLYAISQLDMVPLYDGVVLRFGSEELVLRSADGAPLGYSDFQSADLLGLARPPAPGPGLELDSQISGTIATDVLAGGPGGDLIRGLGAADRLEGLGGADLIYGGAGDDTLYGGTGMDHLDGGAGQDVIYGNSATDQLYGGPGDDLIRGGEGIDYLYGDDGNDQLIGNTAADWLSGGAGHDVLRGSAGQDTLNGDGGDDTLYGGTAADWLYGGDGDDRLYGSQGRDTLFGGDGDDWLSGATAQDRLDGGAGADRLEGGAGADRLIGGAGNDVLRGGTGADTFVFADTFGHDLIEDFRIGADQLELDQSLWGGGLDAAQVLDRFGHLDGTDLILTFGPHAVLTLSGTGWIDDPAASLTLV